MSYTPTEQQTLLQVARESIASGLPTGANGPPELDPAGYDRPLRRVRSSFVTLHLEGRLRGCIGALHATRPLVVDVHHHAYAAAFADPRFRPLAADEFPRLDIHISVLTPCTALEFESETELLDQLRPGVDGLVIAHGERRATFLPAVWASLEEPELFLAQLKRKAGIAPGTRGYRAWRYETEHIPAPIPAA